MKEPKDSTEMGRNRTGVSRAPAEARKTAAGAKRQSSPGSERELKEMRAGFVRESRGMGSLPEIRPGRSRRSSKGRDALALLLDKLGERAAFERTGVRLYEAMILKAEASGGPPVDELRKIRDQELEHFLLVSEKIRSLGGDETRKTPCADATGVASRGILQVVADPRADVAQSLSALLSAELTDNAGWELLIELCDGLGKPELAEAFRKPLGQENDHVLKVRAWVSEALSRRL